MLTTQAITMPGENSIADSIAIFNTAASFLADIHSKSQTFRDFAVGSSYVQHLLLAIFPVVVNSDVVSPETELHSRNSTLTFDGNDVVIRPLSKTNPDQSQVIRNDAAERALRVSKVQAPRRMSSYVFVAPTRLHDEPSVSKLQSPRILPTEASPMPTNARNSIVEQLVEILISVFSDQIFSRKDFPGLGLFMKVPPGFQEHQAYFETYLLRNGLLHLGNQIKLDIKLLWEPRVLTNLARFATHLSEALFEGWFIDGANAVLDFLGHILEYLQLPDIANIKSIRLCSQTIVVMRAVLLRVILLKLSDLNDSGDPNNSVAFLEKLVYWQNVVLVTQDGQHYYVRLLCYLLYTKLIGSPQIVRMAAANLWRMLLVQKPQYGSDILQEALGHSDSSLHRGFRKIMELDNETFLDWVNDQRENLDGMFLGSLAKDWDNFVAEENRKTEENSRARVNKRREKLKVWQAANLADEEILRRHSVSADHWSSNIYASEHLRRQRALQDQQDDNIFNISTWARMSQDLRRASGLFEELSTTRWQLDQTEGRNRMRKRLIPSKHLQLNLRPKRQQSLGRKSHGNSLSNRQKALTSDNSGSSDQLQVPGRSKISTDRSVIGPVTPPERAAEVLENDEEFEIVEDPHNEHEEYEDKNRKVMRSLHRGDQVDHVLNISRIIGLEACEGLLILGKDFLYLLDNLFQRSDGEIVNVWQAPRVERDPYLQMISGKEASEKEGSSINHNHETRSWRWKMS